MNRFSCGTELIFGPDSLEFLSRFRGEKAMLVTDKFFSQSGLAKQILARAGCPDGVIFDAVQPDPSALLAAQGAALLKQHGPEVLIALGGGSSLDCAKGILAAADQRPVFVAIPTTSGTGSEVTSFSILTHEGVKHPLIDPSMRPDHAILDPTLLQDLPKKLVADSGMDAVSHCVEAFAATGHSPVTDALAGEALHILLTDLPRSLAGDPESRFRVHLAATMAGMAFDCAGLGATHALAHALGGAYHVPHGRLCGLLLPNVMDFNKTSGLSRYAKLARMCGLGAATEILAMRNLRSAIVTLRRQLGLPGSLQEAGIVLEQPQDIAQAAKEDRCLTGNPRSASVAELERILTEAAKP